MSNLKLSENALKIFSSRYLDPGETPEERLRAIAAKIASASPEEDRKYWEGRYYESMAEQYILPNSPTLMNYGKENRVQMGSACFVLPVGDDLSDIFDTIRKAALIHKTGGGTGFNFSSLRPAGALVKTTGKPSSGVIPFMTVFDAATAAVSQGGVRRGANMGILNCNHPDILRFISCKQESTAINNFNLSVGITNEFMDAVMNDLPWELYFLDNSGRRMRFYDDGSEQGKLVTEVVIPAKELFQKIITNAHNNGEPGLIFLDRLQEGNSVPSTPIDATNPCVTGDTTLLTIDGPIPIGTLENKEVVIWNGEAFTAVWVRKTGINTDVIRVVFSDMNYLDCTPNHQFLIQDPKSLEIKKIAACCLESDDLIAPFQTISKENGAVNLVDTDPVHVLKVMYIEKKADVFCFTETINHSGIFNGILTGQCGEQPLPPWSSCVLASIALRQMILTNGDIDWDNMDKVIETGVRLLDSIVTINEYPVPEIKENHDLQRRIGLGLTGLGDLLILKGLSYASIEAREMAAEIMEFINNRSHWHSYVLGKELGNFPAFKGSRYDLNGPFRKSAEAFYQSFLSPAEYAELIASGDSGYQRNAATTTIAPTGSLTTLLGCETYGCEPLFAPGYLRTILDGVELVYTSPLFEQVAKREGFYSPELIHEVSKNGTAIHKGVPPKWQAVFANANEISTMDHMLMQAALQSHCDSGISKTINMASEATIQDVKEAFMAAYRLGTIKGMTVYRDKSRSLAPISIGTKGKESEDRSDDIAIEEIEVEDVELIEPRPIYPISRLKTVSGETTQYQTGCGKTYITVNHDSHSIVEVFAQTGSNGGCDGFTEGLSRVISYTLRLARAFVDEEGLDMKVVMDSVVEGLVDQLSKVRCPVAMRNKKSEGKSCPAIFAKALLQSQSGHFGQPVFQNAPAIAVAEALKEELSLSNCEACGLCDTQGDLTGVKPSHTKETAPEMETIACPECGSSLRRSEGCFVCTCGYSKC